MSRPVRARGLKLGCYKEKIYQTESRPVRARGLKLLYCLMSFVRPHVAPRAGAWIETTE